MVELRTLVRAERVLDGELVQSELLGEHVQLVLRRAAEVDPHDRVVLRQVLGDVRDGEVLGLEHAVAVHAWCGLVVLRSVLACSASDVVVSVVGDRPARPSTREWHCGRARDRMPRWRTSAPASVPSWSPSMIAASIISASASKARTDSCRIVSCSGNSCRSAGGGHGRRWRKIGLADRYGLSISNGSYDTSSSSSPTSGVAEALPARVARLLVGDIDRRVAQASRRRSASCRSIGRRRNVVAVGVVAFTSPSSGASVRGPCWRVSDMAFGQRGHVGDAN